MFYNNLIIFKISVVVYHNADCADEEIGYFCLKCRMFFLNNFVNNVVIPINLHYYNISNWLFMSCKEFYNIQFTRSSEDNLIVSQIHKYHCCMLWFVYYLWTIVQCYNNYTNILSYSQRNYNMYYTCLLYTSRCV